MNQLQATNTTGVVPAVASATRTAVPKRYLNSHEAAAYIGIGHSTLNIHRMHGTGPAFIKWGQNVRYDILELDRWMAEHVVTPAAPAAKRRVGRPRKEGK